MTLRIIIIALIAYIIGSIPWAYIIVRFYFSQDLSQKGTGNIGAMNSYDITGRKWVGIAVFFLDCLKGTAAVQFARLFANADILMVTIAGIFVIIGHNYSAFLKLKGGRGLSTAAGVSLMLNPWMLFIWAVLWSIEYFVIKKNIHIANTAASIFAPVILIFIPVNLIMKLMIMPGYTKEMLIIISISICLLILIRHIKPLKELIREN